MALAKNLIEVPAVGGLNQELERWLPAPYTLLDNYHALKTGAVEKRRGMRRMTKNIGAPSGRPAGTSAWTTAHAVIGTPTGELLTVGAIPEPDPNTNSEKGPYLWSYSQSAERWLPKCPAPGTFVKRRPGIRGEASLFGSPTQAVLISGRYEAVLYRLSSEAWIRIRDLQTGAVHTNNVRVASDLGPGAAGKMVLLNLGDGKITVLRFNTARTQLLIGIIDPVTFAVSTFVAVGGHTSTVSYWDAIRGPVGEVYVARIIPGSPSLLEISRIFAATAVVADSTVEFYSGPAGNVCGLAYQGTKVCAIWDTSSDVLFREYNATTLAPVLAATSFLPTSTFTAAGPLQVAAGYDESGRISLLAHGEESVSGFPAVWKATWLPIGSLTTPQVIPWCLLASKPFRIFGEQYVLVSRAWDLFEASRQFGYALVHLGRHFDTISDERPFSLEGALAPFDSVSDPASASHHLPGPDTGNSGRAILALHVAGVGVRSFGEVPRVWADVFEISSGNFYWSDRLWRSGTASGLLHLTSSLTGQFDGQTLCEIAFLEPPQLVTGRLVNPTLTYGTTGLAGTVSSPGTYTYVAHWEWLDAQGNLHRSRLSDPITVTVAATPPDTAAVVAIELTTTGLTRRGNRDESINSRPRIALYRTLNGGTVFYRCEATAYNAPVSSWSVTLTDDEDDAQLLAAARGTVYTSGGILECETVPCARHVQASGGRVWITSSEAPEVWPSRYLIHGEAPAFSPLLRISLDDAQTPLVGTAWLDGALVIFSESRIYLLQAGAGPSDSGEGSWPRPEEIQSSSGCISAASIVSYADGVLYRDKDGFKLLTRSREVVPIGDAVRDYTDAFPETYDAVLDEANSRILILIANENTGGIDNQGSLVLVWDYGHRVWSTWSAYLVEDDARSPWWYSRMALWKGDPVFTMGAEILRMDLSGTSSSLGLDNYSAVSGDQWVRGTLATPWITSKDQFGREAPLGGFFRVWRAVLEMDRLSEHGLKLSIYSDGEETAPSQVETWSSAQIAALQGLPRERLVVGIAHQKCMAIKLKIEDLPPSGPLPSAPVTGVRYHRTTLEVGIKTGVEKAEKANTR